MRACENNLEPQLDINNLLNNLNQSLPSEFNPRTYKTMKCPLGKYCRLDSKLCLNFHDLSERRRDCSKFKYDWSNCKFIYRAGKYIDPRHCPEGDLCNNSHSVYEFIYHPVNFRQKHCAYEKKGMTCEYIIICPYKHNSDTTNYEEKMCYNKISVDYHVDALREKLKILQNRIKSLNNVLAQHSCLNCKLELNRNYNIINCCEQGGIYCDDCINKFNTSPEDFNLTKNCKCENSNTNIKKIKLSK
jgi:hypothetical protein